MLTNANETIATVRGDYERWRLVVDDVMTSVNSAADDLDATLAATNELMTEKRPAIEGFVDDMQSFGADAAAISAQVRGETMEKVTALLDRGNEGIESFASVLEEIQLEVSAELPNVKEALAQARLAAGQLRLAVAEVRHNPWKVLHRPTTTELEHELLYEAARSFAVAASDLKAASQAVDRVVRNHGDEIADNKETFDRMQQGLLDSYERYAEAQERLLDVLVVDTK